MDKRVPELFLTGFDRNTLFRNNSDGTFRDITASSGLTDNRWGAGAAFGDYDATACSTCTWPVPSISTHATLPLPPPKFCSTGGSQSNADPRGMPGAEDSLYKNLGGGRFRDVSREAGILNGSTYYGLGCIWFDYDDDGDQDIFVANDSCPNFLFRNEKGRVRRGGDGDGWRWARTETNRRHGDRRGDGTGTDGSIWCSPLLGGQQHALCDRGSFFTDSSYAGDSGNPPGNIWAGGPSSLMRTWTGGSTSSSPTGTSTLRWTRFRSGPLSGSGTSSLETKRDGAWSRWDGRPV